MKTVSLGHTGVQVSALNLGCMYMGTYIDTEQSYRLLDQYVDAGGSFLDTANIYAFWVEGFSGGESETVLGQWMQERGNRQQMVVATKSGVTPGSGEPNLSHDSIIAECEKSLQRLQTDYIDLYYAHIDDRATPLEETLGALDKLVQDGKVRHIACSNLLAWRLARARQISRDNGWAEYCCVQQRHTYLRPQHGLTRFANTQVPVTAELLDYARTEGDIAIVAYSVLLGGAYAKEGHPIPENYQPHEYDPADKNARLAALHAVAEETGATTNQVVLAWLMQSQPNIIPLVSSSSLERMQENLDAVHVTLSADQITRLDEARATA